MSTNSDLRSTFFVFNEFPLDVGLAILSHCSPFDLVQLAATAKSTRGLLFKNEHLFDDARYNVARGRCPPTAYALFIFGESPCSICSKPTHHIPSDFHFRFRACSKNCQGKLRSLLTVDRSRPSGLHIPDWRSGLPLVAEEDAYGLIYMVERRAAQRAMDEHEDALAVTYGHPRPHGFMFRRRNIEELQLEYAKRINDTAKLAANARQLKQWATSYLDERLLIRHRNLHFLKMVAGVENVRLSRMLEYPVLQKVFCAFNRDLALITYSVWIEHRTETLTFIASRHKGGKTRKDIPCPYCARSFTVDGLSVHVVAKHQDIDPDTLAVKPASMDGKLHCRDCPRSTRVYTEQALADHRRDKHST
ncbi:hypothetical protein HMN09_00455800 [Mycena chlorophos]|uniref:F-box domain-containing protein n=1 Tax=Mycena chlorophos TaxID=658473 RepID=A0A8H6WJI5_MYCCL|nr:hypothetical protein HMN09_00455800 [Mycena chlorophos]